MDIVRVRRRPQYARILIPLTVVDRTSLVTDVVQRKPFAQSIRASGQLASERIFTIATSSEGIVATLPIRPGTVITPQTVVATLTNPDLEAAVVDANAQLRA